MCKYFTKTGEKIKNVIKVSAPIRTAVFIVIYVTLGIINIPFSK